MKQPVGVILAGGLATRMGGGDKTLLDLGGQSLLTRVIGRFDPQVAALAISANGDPARFARFGLPVLADSVPGYPGPLAGILAGLDWAETQGADTLVSVAGDTPFLPEDLVPRLLLAAEAERQPVALAATPGGLHPTFGLWPVALRAALRQSIVEGQRRVGAWAEARGAARAQFPDVPIDPFFNINRPADLDRAQAIVAERQT